jgi:hypothetical protein
MSPDQAKALRVGQRVRHATHGEGYVSFTSRSGLAVTYFKDHATRGYTWRHVWPLHRVWALSAQDGQSRPNR